MTGKENKCFVFTHAGTQYGVPVMSVLEIVDVQELLPYSGNLPACLGNVIHREKLIPVLDPSNLVGSSPLGHAPRLVTLMRCDDVYFSLATDRFVTVLPLDGIASDGSGSESQGESSRSNPYVVAVRAYQRNTLVFLSASEIGAAVKSSVYSQSVIDDTEELDGERERPPEESEHDMYLCARIAQTLFAIPAPFVLEVIEGYDVTPLFQVSPSLRGLINLRGQVVACFDIAQELGMQPRVLAENSQFVVLHDDDGELALCIDRVVGMRKLPTRHVQGAETVFSPDRMKYVQGVLEHGRDTILVLSVPSVFHSPQLASYMDKEE